MDRYVLCYKVLTRFGVFVLLMVFPILDSFSQKDLVRLYEEKVAQLDTTVYFNAHLLKSTFLFSRSVSFIAISASRYYQNEEIRCFVDTVRDYRRNGNLRLLQIHDSLGFIQSGYNYDRFGRIITHDELIGNIVNHEDVLYPVLKEGRVVYHKKYKQGKLIYEGKLIGFKIADGEHIQYDLNGNVVKRVLFNRGEIVNSTLSSSQPLGD